MSGTPARTGSQGAGPTYRLSHIIAASSAGTVIEWYDYIVFGALAVLISEKFFPAASPTASFLLTLATFATGYVIRPLGAVAFGKIGDSIGRKYAFIMTVLIMGGATTLIGMLPSYQQIGIAAPLVLAVLRLLQGLALGGEYGGAAIYVAEHAPDDKRGYYTSYIQATATVGLLLSFCVVLATRLSLGEAAFQAWGWRVPFLLSFVLVAVALHIRSKLQETPLFARLKEAGRTSRAPVRETLGSRENRRLILLALFGVTAGQAVVWFTAHFYALYFMQRILKVDFLDANVVMMAAVVLGTPTFVLFGWLSDRVGRKKVMMLGNLLAALTFYPLYVGMKLFSSPPNVPALVILVFVQVVYSAMIYGPMAAYLVELFPTRIRYTSLSLPYHLGNGLFGGFTPLIASSLVAASGNIYAGVSYPIVVALLAFVVGVRLLRETRTVRIWDELEGAITGSDRAYLTGGGSGAGGGRRLPRNGEHEASRGQSV